MKQATTITVIMLTSLAILAMCGSHISAAVLGGFMFWYVNTKLIILGIKLGGKKWA